MTQTNTELLGDFAGGLTDGLVKNLAELILARRMIELFPDDTTPTGSVISEDELNVLREKALRQAERLVRQLDEED